MASADHHAASALCLCESRMRCGCWEGKKDRGERQNDGEKEEKEERAKEWIAFALLARSLARSQASPSPRPAKGTPQERIDGASVEAL